MKGSWRSWYRDRVSAPTARRAALPPLSRLAEDALRAEVCRRLFGVHTDVPTIGRYLVRERIGRGGHGEVFAGYDPELRRDVAIKTLRHGIDARAWIVAEGRTLARLSHENIVTVFDVGSYRPPGSAEDRGFLVMELFPHGSLDQVLPTLDRPQVEAALRAAGRGLAIAHAHGVVHCDFKPSNVLFGAEGRVAVADFGLARGCGGGSMPSGGTLGYMAPEQLHRSRPVDARADQYAYCVTWIEAITGHSPRCDDAWQSSLTPATVAALSRGLAEDPEARFPDVTSLLEALGAAAAAKPRRRVRMKWLTAAALAVATVGVVASVRPVSSCDDATSLPWEVDAALVPAGFASAHRRIEEFHDQWLAARQAICESPAARWRPQAQACLDAVLGELRDRLARPVAPITAEAVRIALAGLPSPRRCADPTTLEADAAARDELAQRRALESSQHLERAHAMALSGRFAEAAALAEDALAGAAQPSAPHVRVAALRQLGAAAHRLGDLERARASLEAAYFDALALGDDAAAVAVAREAAIELVYLFGETMSRPDDALRWARHARVLVPEDARGAWWYLYGGIAAAELARGDLAAAREAGVAALRAGRGRDLAVSHRLMCRVELRAGALAAAQQACALARAHAVSSSVTDAAAWAELDTLAAELAAEHGELALAAAHAGVAAQWSRAGSPVEATSSRATSALFLAARNLVAQERPR